MRMERSSHEYMAEGDIVVPQVSVDMGAMDAAPSAAASVGFEEPAKSRTPALPEGGLPAFRLGQKTRLWKAPPGEHTENETPP